MKKIPLPPNINATSHTGICRSATGALTADLILQHELKPVILIAPDVTSYTSWAIDTKFFQSFLKPDNKPTFLAYPEQESDDSPGSFDNHCDRLTVLTRLLNTTGNTSQLVIASTLQAILEPCPKQKELLESGINLFVAKEYSFKELIERLHKMGYDCEITCEGPGQFAIRGGLLDVYPINMNRPCRIDFFGDEVESISGFDPATQLSSEKLNQLTIAPISTQANEEQSDSLLEYLPPETAWFMLEPEKIAANNPGLFQEFEKIQTKKKNFGHLLKSRKDKKDVWFFLSELDTEDSIFQKPDYKWNSEDLHNYRHFPYDGRLGLERLESERKARADFFKQLMKWQDDNFDIHIVLDNKSEEKRLNEIIKEESLGSFKPHYCYGNIQAGFIIRYSKSDKSSFRSNAEIKANVFVTRNEIFGTKRKALEILNRREKVMRSHVDQILDFSELADGDYIVHLQHGICIYRGLQKIGMQEDQSQEVISLEFDNQITIHLPLHESHLLSKYVGLSKVKPKLGKLGTASWDKTRSAAERATLDFAAELLKTQAERKSQEGYAFNPDTEWQKEFERAFTFKETPDQLTAINDAKNDMEETVPTDRLICGDVGFGKTEVALRAAFKAVMDGKQVAMLVPTTVLAQQHFITFRERMADYPVIIEMASRFRKPSQIRHILQQLGEGKIDIIIGTHRLLSKDVVLKDLGLIIIDEEHRFGVKHKEQLKKLSSNIDIISMSATPIPRTLYMALMGVRNLSVIETAPRDRLPIETLVKNYDPELVKKATLRETSRGGQVFYLHNRVQTIRKVAADLQKLMPDLSIAVGHGQMDEKELEAIMTDFVEGKYDMLVCTTIIESGLDIPNCNTIIIEGADRFGLSQLYQLRGRVGRFKRQAYAYLLLHQKSQLLDQARKRLSSLKQHNQLGAGFRIAMRDLELRGAGHLLGEKQSGHIAGVGFDLYCQLLRQSISRLKGEEFASYIRASLKLDFVVMGEGYSNKTKRVDGSDFSILRQKEIDSGSCKTIEGYIPASYINESSLRIDFYRKLAMAQNADEVRTISKNMKDRFGSLPKPTECLILCSEIRCLAGEKYITIVETEGDKLKCHRATGHKQPLIKIGSRFPRLKSKKPFTRLKEISLFIKKQKK